MYNYGLRFILERLFLNYKTEEISLILDGRANKMYELVIEAYIKHLMNDGRLTTREFKIKEIDSRTDPALSCADFPAWAIKAKYEDKNLYFYNIIKRKIVFEKLFPKKYGPWEALCPYSLDPLIPGLTRYLHYIKINKVVNNLSALK